uniref:Uncharacterized protein n=1 Tax=Triticum urartu TaxID=4572 RepID=A0A8R7UA97_TRIUA
MRQLEMMRIMQRLAGVCPLGFGAKQEDSAFVGAPMPSFSSSELSATHCYCCSMMSRWSGSELLCLTTLRTKYSRNTSTATPFWVVGVKGGKWSPKSRQIYTLRDGILRYIV